MSFYLRLWDFDLQAAVQPNGSPATTTANNDPESTLGWSQATTANGMRRRALSNVSIWCLSVRI
jgi:hypothetical protein